MGKKRYLMSKDEFTLTQPKSLIWIGGASSLFFGALIVIMTIFPNDTATWHAYVGFSFFVVLGVFLIVCSLRLKIRVVNDLIYVRPLFGRTKTFNFSEIEWVRLGMHGIAAYSDTSKMFSVGFIELGSNLMVQKLESKGIPFYQ